jgi:hypothetical protein
MSHCVKTGARVLIQELGQVVSADIYAVGSAAFVIRWTLGSETPVTYDVDGNVSPVDYTHIAYQANFDKGDWIREDLGVGVVMRSHLLGEVCDD